MIAMAYELNSLYSSEDAYALRASTMPHRALDVVLPYTHCRQCLGRDVSSHTARHLLKGLQL